jgi:[ribosomal protein S5]-alanine N-acetyltransferase
MATDSAPALEQAAAYPTTPIVTTDRFVIRPLADSDAEGLTAAANDPAIVYYMRNTFPYPYTLEIAKSFISVVKSQSPLVDYCVCLHDGTYVGGVGLKPG